MKSALALAAAMATFAMPALAADMPARVTKAPIVAPVATYNWTGFYTVTGLGGSWWDIRGDYVLPPAGDHHDSTASRFNWSSGIGAQIQRGNWVFGIEGAYNKLYGTGYATSTSPSSACLASTADRACNSRVNNIWTAGGRLGYAWDRFMIFGSGGYANGRIDTFTNVASTGVITSTTSARQDGWYAGAGFEYFVTKFWLSDLILGVEYQHIDLGVERHFDATGLLNANTRDMRATVDTVRARIVFKYPASSPAVVAKY